MAYLPPRCLTHSIENPFKLIECLEYGDFIEAPGKAGGEAAKLTGTMLPDVTFRLKERRKAESVDQTQGFFFVVTFPEKVIRHF